MRLLLLAALSVAFLFPSAAVAKERVEIAMVLWRGETVAEQGFRERLAASPDYEVVVTAFDAGQSKEKLDRILAGLDPKRFRLVYTFGTLVTQAALQQTKELPIIFNIVQRPVEGKIAASMEQPGGWATGASNLVPMEGAFRTLGTLMNIRKLGFVYSSHDPAPLYQLAEIKKQQKRFGFKTLEFPIKGKEGIATAMKQVIDARVDAVIFPSDSFVKANATRIIGILNQHRIPSVVVIPEMVSENGALISLGPDYRTLGQLAADNALLVLKGSKPGHLPVRVVPQLSIMINLATADRLGIHIPLQLLSVATVVKR
ncbi:MAG: ABC transporter substrate-binding protein [Geobacter sp.]|nr:ABC transporter substrate-binding protein [Geobacter sp.]